MSEPTTHYGVSEASKLMSAFHLMGNELLTNLLQYYSEPHKKKALFPFLLIWNSVCIRVTMQLPKSKCRAFNERLNHTFRYRQS